MTRTTSSTPRIWILLTAALAVTVVALVWRDRTRAESPSAAPGGEPTGARASDGPASPLGRAPRASRAAGEPDDVDDDAATVPGAPARTPPRPRRSTSTGGPQPDRRGSVLDASDPCEPLVEAVVPASFERVVASSVTVAWAPGVIVREPTALAYTIAGLLEEAANLTGTDPREDLTVFVHASRDALHLATDTPEWTSGVYDGAVHVVAEPRNDFGVRLPTLRHEIMHAQLHAGVGCMPAWFNEGVAQLFAGRPPVATWMAMLKERRPLDLDALSVPTLVEAPEEDTSSLYATSLAMVLFELDRAGESGLARVVGDLHTADPPDPRLRARTLWKKRNPSVGSSDVRAALARRIFGVSSERELEAIFRGRVCCAGERRLEELTCGAEASLDPDDSSMRGVRCVEY